MIFYQQIKVPLESKVLLMKKVKELSLERHLSYEMGYLLKKSKKRSFLAFRYPQKYFCKPIL